MEEKIFVSEKISKVVKKHIPNDGVLLTAELTELFTQLLVQAVGYGIEMYVNKGIKSEGS